MNEKEKTFYFEESFIESPIFDNWFKKHYPKKSLLICSPFIKKDALEKVIELYNLDKRFPDFDLKVLIRGNKEEFTHQKSSDISALDSLISLNKYDISNVRRITNLHMKAYLIDGIHLLITSGNMTNSGMFVFTGKENFEGGIAANKPIIINKFLYYFTNIWQQGQPIEEFYDDIKTAYVAYIEQEYSDKEPLQKINRKRYHFDTRSSHDDLPKDTKEINEWEKTRITGPSLDELINDFSQNRIVQRSKQSFSLTDIPPVGRPEHLPQTLQIMREHPDGISYVELGKKLRPLFSSSSSNTDGANGKFGEEKGKFASFLDLARIEKSDHGNIFKISDIGKEFLGMSEDNRKKLIKDIFFDKSIIVSILRRSIEDRDFNLKGFLLENCEDASDTTLSRKVGPLKELFSLIKSTCTESELRDILDKI